MADSADDENVNNFQAITHASEENARMYLTAADNDLQNAIEMFFAGVLQILSALCLCSQRSDKWPVVSNVDAVCNICQLQPIMGTTHEDPTTQVLHKHMFHLRYQKRNKPPITACHSGHSSEGAGRSDLCFGPLGLSSALH